MDCGGAPYGIRMRQKYMPHKIKTQCIDTSHEIVSLSPQNMAKQYSTKVILGLISGRNWIANSTIDSRMLEEILKYQNSLSLE